MSIEQEIETYRRNSRLSTGPRTSEGKAKAANNSRTHGLCSRNAVLPEEDLGEFQALLARLRSQFQPANAVEEFLVRELASAKWRLCRILRIETGLFEVSMERVREDGNCPNTARSPARTPEQRRYDQNTRLLALAFRRHCGDEAFNKLLRYKNNLRRAYYRALKELKTPPHDRPADRPQE